MAFSDNEIHGTASDERREERNWMVDSQLASHGIKNETVLASMRTVPRHFFVGPDMEAFAYYDEPLRIHEGQTISQPYIVALMAEALEPAAVDRILEIGTGSGYSAAVLSRIVTGVYTIERHERLAQEAAKRFQDLGYKNIEVRIADGTKGWPEESPFDGILVTAGGPVIPESLRSQLAIGGRLVIPVGVKGHQELIRVLRLSENDFAEQSLGLVRFVPLIGEEGWDGQGREQNGR